MKFIVIFVLDGKPFALSFDFEQILPRLRNITEIERIQNMSIGGTEWIKYGDEIIIRVF